MSLKRDFSMEQTSERQVVTALLSCLFVTGVHLPLPCFPLPVVGVKYEARYRDKWDPEVRLLMEIIPSMSMVGALQFEPLGFQIWFRG